MGDVVVKHGGRVSARFYGRPVWVPVCGCRHPWPGHVERGPARRQVVRERISETFFGDIMPGQRGCSTGISGIFPGNFVSRVARSSIDGA